MAEVIGDLEYPPRPDPGHGGPRQRAGHQCDVVLLAYMLGYVNTLWSMTQGRATYTMTFDHYAPVPMPPDDDDPFAPAVGMRA